MKKRALFLLPIAMLLCMFGCDGMHPEKWPIQEISPSEQNNVSNVATPKVQAEPDLNYPFFDNSPLASYPSRENEVTNLKDLTAPTSVSIPAKGKVSASGLLYAYDMQVPLSNMTFLLVPAHMHEGEPYMPPIITNGNPEHGDVIGKTDQDGHFYLDDIEPGLYFLLINYPDHTEVAVETNNTTTNRLFEFEANESYILGVIKIRG